MCFHEEQTFCVYSNCAVLKFHFRAVDIQYSIHNNIIKIVNILGNIAFLDVPFTTLKTIVANNRMLSTLFNLQL